MSRDWKEDATRRLIRSLITEAKNDNDKEANEQDEKDEKDVKKLAEQAEDLLTKIQENYAGDKKSLLKEVGILKDIVEAMDTDKRLEKFVQQHLRELWKGKVVVVVVHCYCLGWEQEL